MERERDTSEARSLLSRRRFLLGGLATLAAAGVPAYAFGVELHWLDVVRRALPIAGLPDALAGRTLIQISDLTGAYGVSFLAALINGVLVELALRRWPAHGAKPTAARSAGQLRRRPSRPTTRSAEQPLS